MSWRSSMFSNMLCSVKATGGLMKTGSSIVSVLVLVLGLPSSGPAALRDLSLESIDSGCGPVVRWQVFKDR